MLNYVKFPDNIVTKTLPINGLILFKVTVFVYSHSRNKVNIINEDGFKWFNVSQNAPLGFITILSVRLYLGLDV